MPAKTAAEHVAAVCDRRLWDRLPAALEQLESERYWFSGLAAVPDADLAELNGDMALALGRVREAAMAEMSKGLCR